MNKSVTALKLKVDTNYNTSSFLLQHHDGVEILDYVRRLENLKAVYEILFDKMKLAVTCNDCPFIDFCMEQGNKTDDCQIRMLQTAKILGVGKC